MTNRYLLCLLLGLAVAPTYGQGIADYYRLPDRSQQYTRLLSRYGGPYIRDRWYVALDGFVRTDRARIDNTFNGLIESDRVTKPGIGATIGWLFRERWAVEAGYARMPIHTQLSISNRTSPLVFKYANSKDAFVLRGKRLIVSTSGPWLRSGFWLSGGIWAVANNGKPTDGFLLKGLNYRGRYETPDTLHLQGQTQGNTRVTTMAELGAEYNIRLSNSLDLGFSVRKFWGLSTAVTTNVAYTINNRPGQQAQLSGTGTGMSYGFALRYTYAIRRNLSNAMNVQGKQRIQ